jgi:HEAT repeat protein
VLGRRIVFASLAVLLADGSAWAGSAALAFAKPGGGQPGLAVGFTPEGQLRAGVCAAAPCSLDHATAVPVPDAAAKLASGAKLRVVRVGEDRKAVVVEIPDPTANRTWAAVLAAPPGGGAPLVAFNGYTGLVGGTEDERTGPMLAVRDTVYVGTQREGFDLCGRPAMLSPTALDPKTLTLKPAKLQRLDDAERAAAPTITAEVSDAAAAPPLLHATWATSAAPGSPPSAVTDGNPATVWAEDRGGAGRGELVVTSAPRAVALGAFELTVPARIAPHTAVPREAWLVTDHEVFHVVVPEPPNGGAAHYVAPLPAPVKTGCVALVLDGASAEDPEAMVSVAELSARPAAAASLDELVHALGGGGPEAEAAAGVLRAGGNAAFTAVAASFAGLDEGGRRVALDVLDDAPCDIALPVYVSALTGSVDAQRLHARRALARCAAQASPAFEQALEAGDRKQRILLADELATVAPAAAVPVLFRLLGKSKALERRAFRGALAHAATAADARPAVTASLEDAAAPPVASLDLLRALGAAAPEYGVAASHAFARLATPTANFRTRYLLLGPASDLAKVDPTARVFIERALTTETDPRIRAEAARVLRDGSPYRVHLSRLLDDPGVRVREAALGALGAAHAEEARDRMLYVLAHDEWPLVRVAAAHAVAELPQGPAVDEALSSSLSDPSSDVRRAAVRAIGVRGATADAAAIRERFADDEELVSIRAEAAISLGRLCDFTSLPALTERARALTNPMAGEEVRLLGKSSLVALGLMHPGDLAQRIAPLSDKAVPAVVRLLARTVLAAKGRCPAPKPAGRPK